MQISPILNLSQTNNTNFKCKIEYASYSVNRTKKYIQELVSNVTEADYPDILNMTKQLIHEINPERILKLSCYPPYGYLTDGSLEVRMFNNKADYTCNDSYNKFELDIIPLTNNTNLKDILIKLTALAKKPIEKYYWPSESNKTIQQSQKINPEQAANIINLLGS